jgi:hypothetical protein
MADKLDQFGVLIERLVGDSARSAAAVNRRPVAYHRRQYFRAAFALVEGTLYGMKQVTLEASEQFGVSLSLPERALLAEEAYELKDNGTIRIRASYPKFPSNLRFAFATIGKAHKCAIPLDIDATGWAQLLASVQVRNRITHPKQPNDLDVTDAEVQALQAGLEWFSTTVARMARLLAEAYERMEDEPEPGQDA